MHGALNLLVRTQVVNSTRLLQLAALAVTTLLLPINGAYAVDYTPQLTALAQGKIKAFAESPLVVAAIEAQNAKTAAYDQAKIDAMDGQWKAEVSAADKPLIAATMGNAASKYLVTIQDGSQGLFTEDLRHRQQGAQRRAKQRHLGLLAG